MVASARATASAVLPRAWRLSLAAAALLLATGLAGIAFSRLAYPTDDLRYLLLPNDVATVAVAVPALVGSMLLARRGRLLGLLLWPGALLNGLYGSVALVVGAPHLIQKATFGTLALLCGWATVDLLRAIDHQEVRARLAGHLPERLGATVLVAFGCIVIVRATAELIAATGGEPRTAAEIGTAVADLVAAPLMVLGGLWLWRRRPLGYGLGTGLLFQASILFIALLLVFAVQPLLTNRAFAAADFVVVAVMGLVCFVPCGLFVRGVMHAEKDRAAH